MCAVSAVGDGWTRDFNKRFPDWQWQQPAITRQEFLQLKREVEELKKLLEAAKKFDEATGQPDCEMEDKIALLKKIADVVGVDLSSVFGKPADHC